jgi:hypothetical protein
VSREIEFLSHRASAFADSRIADWSLIVIPGVVWGASFLFIAEGLNAVGAMGVTLLRIAIGFAALACFPGAWKPIDRRDWVPVGWLGLLWMAFPLSMFPFAEQRISSAIAGMLNGAVPLDGDHRDDHSTQAPRAACSPASRSASPGVCCSRSPT